MGFLSCVRSGRRRGFRAEAAAYGPEVRKSFKGLEAEVNSLGL